MRYLICVEESEHARTALFAALRLVQAERDEIILLLIGHPSIYQLEPLTLDDELGRLGGFVTALAHECTARLPGLKVDGTVVRGDPVSDICAEAAARAVDVIVLGSRGLGPLQSALLGSVSSGVIDTSDKPVMVIRSAFPDTSARSYLFCHDHETQSSRTAFAAMLAMVRPGDTVTLLAVQAPLGPGSLLVGHYDAATLATHEAGRAAVQRELDELAATLAAKHVSCVAMLRTGDARTEILEVSKAQLVDVLVLGSRHLKPLQRLLHTSVSNSTFHNATAHAVLIAHRPPPPQRV